MIWRVIDWPHLHIAGATQALHMHHCQHHPEGSLTWKAAISSSCPVAEVLGAAAAAAAMADGLAAVPAPFALAAIVYPPAGTGI